MSKYYASIAELKSLGFTYNHDHRWIRKIVNMQFNRVELECWEYEEFELLIINKDQDFDHIFLRPESYDDLKIFMRVLGVKDE